MTSADILHLVCTILAPALGLAVWLLQRYLVRQWKQIARLRKQVRSLTGANAALRNQLSRARDNWRKCYDFGIIAKQKLERARRLVTDLRHQIDEARRAQPIEPEPSEPVEETAEESGRVWERPIAADAPAFVPLAERHVPIVSIINLKGGVGKTTIAANLAAALGMQGARVLLLDLDYQRSLSLLCCSSKQIEQLHREERCLQHFLLDEAPDAPRLLGCVTPVKTAESCSIVVNSEALAGDARTDSLEDAEMHLLAEWLMTPNGADSRFHLRRALHDPLIGKQFDYVLLDCPPRLSTACVNALAASDFALIPVMLDMTSALSVPNLLRKLRRLRGDGLLAHLELMGVVANRVKLIAGKLKNAEEAVLGDVLRPQCDVAWEGPVHFFPTTIKESSAVAEAAQRHADGKATFTFAAQKGELQAVFAELAEQVKGRIAHDSRRLAAIPS